MPSKILSLLSPSCVPLAGYIKVIQNNKPAPATRSIHISILPSLSIEKILNKNDRDQVLRARETRHLTQTLVFTKTAGRHNLVEVIVTLSLPNIERFLMTSRRPYRCSKAIKRRPYWCPKPVLWELNSLWKRFLLLQ